MPAAIIVHHWMTAWAPAVVVPSVYYRINARLYGLDVALCLKASDNIGLKVYAKECINVLKAKN